MKALRIDRFGPLEDLDVREVPDEPLRDGDVRVAIEAAGVNPSDAGVALGRFPRATLPRILGRDFAGTVVEGPPELLGVPVWGSGGGELGMTRDGTHAEHLVLPASAVIRRPAGLRAEEAAVTGVPFVTAWSALVELAALRPGEWAIVSAAAGAVGIAALQLVNSLEGRAIALVRQSDDLAPLVGLTTAAILRSDVDDVPSAVRELTAGRGADVALNGVGSSIFSPLTESLAKGGRMVVFSARGGSDAHLDLFSFYRRRLTLFGLDTAGMSLGEVARIYRGFGKLFESGAVKAPPIAARVPLAQAREAYARVQRGHSGKVVLIPAGAAEEAAAAYGAAAASPSTPDAASAPPGA